MFYNTALNLVVALRDLVIDCVVAGTPHFWLEIKIDELSHAVSNMFHKQAQS